MVVDGMELTFKELDEEVADEINTLFPKNKNFIEVLPGNMIVPRKFAEVGESVGNLEIYPDDVWLVSYPRTGSTWAQEMIWLLGNQLDFEGAKQMLQIRAPIVELSALFSEDHHDWVADVLGDTVETVRNMTRPRFVRSHLPLHLLPKNLFSSKAKVIYTARNPKDLCVSFYHYCKLMHDLRGSINEFVNLFIKERTPIGSYWKHVLPFWERRNDPNVLFLKYEEMNRNLPAVVRKCADFLNVNYQISDEDMTRICEHLKFDKMQLNSAVNLDPILNRTDDNGNRGGVEATPSGREDMKFIRKGQIGDWRNYITDDVSKQLDEWIAVNTKGSGLSFDYE